MTLSSIALAEIQKYVDPNASQIDPVEAMDGGGWATAFKSGNQVYRLFYTPQDGYEAYLVGEIDTDTQDGLATTDSIFDRSRRKVKKVMHEWKQGELNVGTSSKKVPRTRRGQRQAIAIALSEAGLSKTDSELIPALRQQIRDAYIQIGRDSDRPLPFD